MKREISVIIDADWDEDVLIEKIKASATNRKELFREVCKRYELDTSEIKHIKNIREAESLDWLPYPTYKPCNNEQVLVCTYSDLLQKPTYAIARYQNKQFIIDRQALEHVNYWKILIAPKGMV